MDDAAPGPGGADCSGRRLVRGLTAFRIRTAVTFDKVALGVAIGGALSNVIDQARVGSVRDFIDFHSKAWNWPSFNFVDAFIVVGLFSLMLPIGSLKRKST